MKRFVKGYEAELWYEASKAQMPNFTLFLLLPVYLICRTLIEQKPSNDFWDELK